MNPCSSARTEKMKSLCATGRNLYCPCVPCMKPFAGQTAGSDGDPGLDLLVAVTARILLRIEERGDAGLLIILERELPGERRHQDGDERDHAEQPHAHAGEIGDAEEHGNQRDGGAEVRLPGDEQQRHRREEAADDQVADVAGAAPVLAEVHRENQRQDDAAELGRLQVERTDLDPALRAELRWTP